MTLSFLKVKKMRVCVRARARAVCVCVRVRACVCMRVCTVNSLGENPFGPFRDNPVA